MKFKGTVVIASPSKLLKVINNDTPELSSGLIGSIECGKHLIFSHKTHDKIGELILDEQVGIFSLESILEKNPAFNIEGLSKNKDYILFEDFDGEIEYGADDLEKGYLNSENNFYTVKYDI